MSFLYKIGEKIGTAIKDYVNLGSEANGFDYEITRKFYIFLSPEKIDKKRSKTLNEIFNDFQPSDPFTGSDYPPPPCAFSLPKNEKLTQEQMADVAAFALPPSGNFLHDTLHGMKPTHNVLYTALKALESFVHNSKKLDNFLKKTKKGEKEDPDRVLMRHLIGNRERNIFLIKDSLQRNRDKEELTKKQKDILEKIREAFIDEKTPPTVARISQQKWASIVDREGFSGY